MVKDGKMGWERRAAEQVPTLAHLTLLMLLLGQALNLPAAATQRHAAPSLPAHLRGLQQQQSSLPACVPVPEPQDPPQPIFVPGSQSTEQIQVAKLVQLLSANQLTPWGANISGSPCHTLLPSQACRAAKVMEPGVTLWAPAGKEEAVVNASGTAFSVEVGPGATLHIVNTRLTFTTLPNRKAAAALGGALVPLPFLMRNGSTLLLRNVTLVTASCNNMYTFFTLLLTSPGNKSSVQGWPTLPLGTRQPAPAGHFYYAHLPGRTNLTLYNVTFTCSGLGFDTSRSMIAGAEDGAELLSLLRATSSLMPATLFIPPGGVTLPQGWPNGSDLVVVEESPLVISGRAPGEDAAAGAGVAGGIGTLPVLDLGMIPSLLRLGAGAVLSFSNLLLANLCRGVFQADTLNAASKAITTTQLWMVQWSMDYPGLRLSNVALLVESEELLAHMRKRYAVTVGAAFPRYQAYAAGLLAAWAWDSASAMTPSSITFRAGATRQVLLENYTLTSELPPEALALGFKPRTPQWCTGFSSPGPLLPEPFAVTRTASQLWAQLERLAMLSAFEYVVAFTEKSSPVILAVMESVLDFGQVWSDQRSQGKAAKLAVNMVVAGPLDPPLPGGLVPQVTLDLGRLASSLTLASPRVHLYLLRLAIKGLPPCWPVNGDGAADSAAGSSCGPWLPSGSSSSSPLNSSGGSSAPKGVPGGSGGMLQGLALPLWPFHFNRSSQVSLHLADVELELPQAEYRLLLRAATSADGPAGVAELRGLSVLQASLPPDPQALAQGLLLAYFEGWGVNGTGVRLRPDTPLTMDDPLLLALLNPPSNNGSGSPPDQPGSGSDRDERDGSSSGSGLPGWAVAVIVVCSVAVVALLLGVPLAVVFCRSSGSGKPSLASCLTKPDSLDQLPGKGSNPAYLGPDPESGITMEFRQNPDLGEAACKGTGGVEVSGSVVIETSSSREELAVSAARAERKQQQAEASAAQQHNDVTDLGSRDKGLRIQAGSSFKAGGSGKDVDLARASKGGAAGVMEQAEAHLARGRRLMQVAIVQAAAVARQQQGAGANPPQQQAQQAQAQADPPSASSAQQAQQEGSVTRERATSMPDPDSGTGSKIQGQYAPSLHSDPPSAQSVASSCVAKPLDPSKKIREMIQQISKGGSNDAERLVLLQQIGKGGYGTVHRGRWLNLDVAVKTLLFQDRAHPCGSRDPCPGSSSPSQGPGSKDSNAPSADPGSGEVAAIKAQQHQHLNHQALDSMGAKCKMVLKEAAVCSALSHANVVATYHYHIVPVRAGRVGATQVVESGATLDYKLYLVQELCDTSLYQALETGLLHGPPAMQGGPPVPHLAYVLLIMGDVVAGMMYLHSKNIVHGDLSPSNVLLKVTQNEETQQVDVVAKISDFGLCQLLDPLKTHVSNHNVGTPFYVAPEVTHDHKLTKQSDVYSFGVMLWEAYTGQHPYLTSRQGFRRNPSLGRYPPWAPRLLARLTARCLSRRPGDRPAFQDCMALLQRVFENPHADASDEDLFPTPTSGATAATAAAGTNSSSASKPHDPSPSQPPSPRPHQPAQAPQQALPRPPQRLQLQQLDAAEAVAGSSTPPPEAAAISPTGHHPPRMQAVAARPAVPAPHAPPLPPVPEVAAPVVSAAVASAAVAPAAVADRGPAAACHATAAMVQAVAEQAAALRTAQHHNHVHSHGHSQQQVGASGGTAGGGPTVGSGAPGAGAVGATGPVVEGPASAHDHGHGRSHAEPSPAAAACGTCDALGEEEEEGDEDEEALTAASVWLASGDLSANRRALASSLRSSDKLVLGRYTSAAPITSRLFHQTSAASQQQASAVSSGGSSMLEAAAAAIAAGSGATDASGGSSGGPPALPANSGGVVAGSGSVGSGHLPLGSH